MPKTADVVYANRLGFFFSFFLAEELTPSLPSCHPCISATTGAGGGGEGGALFGNGMHRYSARLRKLRRIRAPAAGPLGDTHHHCEGEVPSPLVD